MRLSVNIACVWVGAVDGVHVQFVIIRNVLYRFLAAPKLIVKFVFSSGKKTEAKILFGGAGLLEEYSSVLFRLT